MTIAGGQVFSASALKTDEDTGLMLIHIAEAEHGLTALPFARTALIATAPLYAVRFNPDETEPFSSVAGSVTQLPAGTDESPLIIHNALFNVTAAGTAVAEPVLGGGRRQRAATQRLPAKTGRSGGTRQRPFPSGILVSESWRPPMCPWPWPTASA